MQDFRRLEVWQKSHRIVLDVYATTSTFPREERFALTSQIRRTAVSIAANIAEGCGRGGDRDFMRFLYVSLGSACELEYHLLLASDLAFLAKADYHRLRDSVIQAKQMLAKLIARLKADS